jgi:hypothetical protein
MFAVLSMILSHMAYNITKKKNKRTRARASRRICVRLMVSPPLKSEDALHNEEVGEEAEGKD